MCDLTKLNNVINKIDYYIDMVESNSKSKHTFFVDPFGIDIGEFLELITKNKKPNIYLIILDKIYDVSLPSYRYLSNILKHFKSHLMYKKEFVDISNIIDYISRGKKSDDRKYRINKARQKYKNEFETLELIVGNDINLLKELHNKNIKKNFAKFYFLILLIQKSKYNVMFYIFDDKLVENLKWWIFCRNNAINYIQGDFDPSVIKKNKIYEQIIINAFFQY